jgi:orotate phosphoribosyltransferase
MNTNLLSALAISKAIRLGVKTGPGRIIPVYWDPKAALSQPETLRAVIKALAEIINELGVKVIAGGETGGISLAAGLALETNLPWVYIRKKPKGYSTNLLVEGSYDINAPTVLVDDVVATGMGKEEFIINANGLLDIKHLVVVFDDSDQIYKTTLKQRGINFYSLVTFEEFVEYLHQTSVISNTWYDFAKAYIKDRDNWQNDKTLWQRFMDQVKNEGIEYE